MSHTTRIRLPEKTRRNGQREFDDHSTNVVPSYKIDGRCALADLLPKQGLRTSHSKKQNGNGHARNVTLQAAAVPVSKTKQRNTNGSLITTARMSSAVSKPKGGGVQAGVDHQRSNDSPTLSKKFMPAKRVPPTPEELSQWEERNSHPDILTLKMNQSQRKSAQQMVIRIWNNSLAMVRRSMGWTMETTDKGRAKVNKAASQIVKDVEAGKKTALTGPVIAYILQSAAARASFEKLNEGYKDRIEKVAKTFPTWINFGSKIKGFSTLALGTIVGEAGNLWNYKNPAKLWRRFGLGVDGGSASSTHRMKKTLAPDGWEEIGYCPRRRSVMYVVGESLVKGNKTGYYRTLYLNEKKRQCKLHPEFEKGLDEKTGRMKTTKRCDLMARRYMEKRLLKHLWQAWRKQKIVD
jgi:hypothetical protein